MHTGLPEGIYVPTQEHGNEGLIVFSLTGFFHFNIQIISGLEREEWKTVLQDQDQRGFRT